MKKLPNNPVVVITGASAGVGRATVRRFACTGARIALIARGREGLAAAAKEVEEAGGKALILPCDVADHDALDAAADEVETTFGPIDVWVNVAFAGILAPFLDVDPEDYKRVTEVTYLGQVNGTRAALKRMVPRNRGSVVLVGSALAYRGIPLQSAYCGSKHAIQGFHDLIRAELFHMKSDVHVAMVQLPGVNTPQFDWIKTTMPKKPKPASPPYQPEVVARAIHYAAHHRRKAIWVAYPTVEAILGDRAASPLLDRYLGRTGVKGQQDKEPVEPDRSNNLWSPVEGDRGAHGRFDDTARSSSWQLSLSLNRGKVVAAGLTAAAGLASVLLHRTRSYR